MLLNISKETHEWKDRKACLWKTFDKTGVW